MTIAVEIRQVANSVGVERPDVATRLLHIAVRVERLELGKDDIAADPQVAEQLRHPMSPPPPGVIEFPRRRWQRP